MPRGSPLPFPLRHSGGEYTLKDACYAHGITHDWIFEESGCPETGDPNCPKLIVQQTSVECKAFDNINSEIEYFSPDASESGC